MKTKMMALFLLSALSFQTAMADEVYLPQIQKPSVLNEGTERNLTDAQIAELLPWAKDSKMFLLDLVDSTQGLSSEDKIERLDYGIKQVVGDSAPKHSELLMRYVLNRAIVVKDILNKEMDASVVGTADSKLRVLLTSINMAVKYYDVDMNTLTKKSIPDFQSFANDYFKFLTELDKSIFDASAQYSIQRTSLEWLQWDLYRDLNNTRHAPKIVKINNALKMAPTGKLSDAQSIKNIQQLKRIINQLDIVIKAPEQNNDDVVTDFGLNRNDSSALYGYSTSYAKCYKKSASGELMYSAQVSDAYCAKDGVYKYSTSYAKCYKVSNKGDTMYSSQVSDAYCAKEATYKYSTSYAKCYKVSNAGDTMYSSQVSDAYCAQDAVYKYSTSYAKCYKVSNAGDTMYSSQVSDAYCAKDGAYKYNSSYGKCYKVSNDGDTMYSSQVSASYCTAN